MEQCFVNQDDQLLISNSYVYKHHYCAAALTKPTNRALVCMLWFDVCWAILAVRQLEFCWNLGGEGQAQATRDQKMDLYNKNDLNSQGNDWQIVQSRARLEASEREQRPRT